MSTLQSSISGAWGDDGYEWPEWMGQYDNPVVRASTNSRKRMHAPDLTADRPQPACEIGSREGSSFVGAERANVEGFYSECRCDECQEWFADGGEQ